jgi:hypothetical protein
MSAREVIARAACANRSPEDRLIRCDGQPCHMCCRDADAILAALDAAPETVRLELARRLAGEAWRVVPVEPTLEMLNRGYYAHEYEDHGPGGVYRAMLAAAAKEPDHD